MIKSTSSTISAGPLVGDVTEAGLRVFMPGIAEPEELVPELAPIAKMLTYSYVPTVAGLYSVLWFALQDGRAWNSVAVEPCTFTDTMAVAAGIRGTDGLDVSADMLRTALSVSMRSVFNVLNWSDARYNELDIADAVLFDTALAYLICAFCSDFAPTSNVTGEVSKVVTNVDSVSYFRRYAASERKQEEAYEDKAWALLLSIRSVNESVDSEPGYSVFALGGRRRATNTRLGVLANPLYDLWADTVLGVMYGGYPR